MLTNIIPDGNLPDGSATPLLSAKHASSILCVTIGTLAKWRVYGNGPKFIRVNRRIAYHPKDIADWLNARRVCSTSEGAAGS
jgi:hypothetical protein